MRFNMIELDLIIDSVREEMLSRARSASRETANDPILWVMAYTHEIRSAICKAVMKGGIDS